MSMKEKCIVLWGMVFADICMSEGAFEYKVRMLVVIYGQYYYIIHRY